MFQNIDEAGLYSYFTPSPPTPVMRLLDQPGKQKLVELQQQVAAAEQQLAHLRDVKRPTFDLAETLADLRANPSPFASPGELGRFAFDALDGGKLANSVKPDQPATLHGENKLVPGKFDQAVEFTGDDPVNLPFGNFHRHDPFTIALWLKTPDVKERAG
jgi:hypothetical protein